MSNPLLVESPYPYGAPQFDKIKTEHYLPAFKQGIVEAKADIDNIVNCPDEKILGPFGRISAVGRVL